MVAPITVPRLANKTSPPQSANLPLPLTLDRNSADALHVQLAAQLRAGVTSGTLSAGVVLPGSRAMAGSLRVTRGVVTLALAELAAEGVLDAVSGVGMRVAAGAARPATPPTTAALPAWFVLPPPAPVDAGQPREGISFKPGVAASHLLDVRAWRAAWQAATRTAPSGDYGPAAGSWPLRVALAAFLTRSRGLSADPACLMVTAGSLSALGLIAGLLPRGSRVLFENPGYRAARQVLLDAGHTVIPVPIDENGLITDNLPPARLVVVTPSHQYPLGVRMGVPRRLALLEWARQHDALIVEDDYDGEFRYGAPPLPPLTVLDEEGGGRVLYLGTLSKVLTPAVRTGFVVAPTALLPALERARVLADAGHNTVTQDALTHFILGGHLDRHVRRARRWHGQQQAALASALAPLTEGNRPLAQLGGIEAGLHACLHLTPPLKAETVAAALAQRGVFVGTLSTFMMQPVPEETAQQALVLGYGGLTVAQIETGARAIVEVVRAESARLAP
ncbi:PLP-dependent aminotransferase family protein [Deinococcus sp. QL22]|uniref:MocR-like pyridoxine biosynthesis transcription factor PdxR n=1 Tax=Deinococcus sp. QL22 TaxID=2939437 RepID=UPI002016D127|nr:PLP-dependent aminotransferase family protein [Deinococcus sp. QL22]UQN05670.1 PLP-dependent aminotransferase family protein [Deinococcus sp. QL22]